MSATNTAMSLEPAIGKGSLPSRWATAFAGSISLLVIGTLAWFVVQGGTRLAGSWAELLPWVAAMALTGLFAVHSRRGRSLTPSASLAGAVAVVFPPYVAALIAFAGFLDERELRLQISPGRAIFNRSQAALATLVGSIAAHAFEPQVDEGLLALVIPATTAFVVTAILNYLLVSTVSALADRVPLQSALFELKVGAPTDLLIAWSMWCLSAILLIDAYARWRSWAVMLFGVALLSGARLLARSESSARSEARLRVQSSVIRDLSQRIATERQDERRRVAAELHDDVMQHIHRVTLLAQVIRQDLASGRLLELEEDMPPFHAACEEASAGMRSVLRDLRTSPVGIHGATESLRSLANDLALHSTADIRVELVEIQDLHADLQLVTYQVCREALVNAVRHAEANQIVLRLMRDDEHIRFSIEDDGHGFSAATQGDSRDAQLGLSLIRERVEMMGGLVHILSDTCGTIVAGRLPMRRSPR